MARELVHAPGCRAYRQPGGRPLPWKFAAGVALVFLAAMLLPQAAKPAKPPAVGAAAAGWSAAGTTGIPAAYRGLYVKAAKTCRGLTPYLLAGVGKVESDHGRSRAPGVRSGRNRHGCCAGPMQFNLTNGPPSTWDGWSRPGDSPYDPADAIGAAARKLCHDGLQLKPWNVLYQGRLDPCPGVGGSNASNRALRRYNNECEPYAKTVIAWAARYAPDGARAA